MIIYKGTDRTAFLGERYTVKIARSNPRRFLKYAKRTHERSGFRGVVDAWKKYDPDQRHSLKHSLLHGIDANRREQRLATQSDNIVVPTVSILKGLVNIQPTATSTGLEYDEILSAFVDRLGSKVTVLGHMLEDPGNFGVGEGRDKFVDGGSIGLEDLVQTQPESIQQALGSLTLQLDVRA